LAGVWTVAAPAYRTITSRQGLDFKALANVPLESLLQQPVSGRGNSEFDILVVQSAAINRSLALGWGKGFYNFTIGQLVPRQIVGEEVKNSFMIGGGSEKLASEVVYEWRPPYGFNPTGPVNAFEEFWFFGAVCYFGMGWAFRWLWNRAVRQRDFGFQVWYVVLINLAPVSIVACLVMLPSQILILTCIVAPALWFAREHWVIVRPVIKQ